MKKKRRYLCSVALGSKVYAIGGYDGAGRLNSVECYDVIAQEWTTAASMVHRRGLAGAAVLNGKIEGLCRWSDNNMRGGGGNLAFVTARSAHVYCSLVTLLSSSQYQDAFPSLAPT